MADPEQQLYLQLLTGIYSRQVAKQFEFFSHILPPFKLKFIINFKLWLNLSACFFEDITETKIKLVEDAIHATTESAT